MRIIIVFFMIHFSILSYASEIITIDVVTDIAVSDPKSELDLITGLMVHIGEGLPSQFELNLIEGSRKREWRQLTDSDNVCLYNKVKTQKREAIAQFSKYPIATFPANRLTILKSKKSEIHSSEPLKEAIIDRQLKIGITIGRAYGEYIDDFIKANNALFIKGEGQTSADRQRKMLMKGRLDGVIEYSTVFINQFSAEKVRQELEFLEIENTQASIFGYIACSKSKLGLSIINEINEIMSQENIQQHIIDSHKKAFFNPQEQRIIAKEFHKKFKQ